MCSPWLHILMIFDQVLVLDGGACGAKQVIGDFRKCADRHFACTLIARSGAAEALPLIGSECVVSSACRHEDEIALAGVQAIEPPHCGPQDVIPTAAFASCLCMVALSSDVFLCCNLYIYFIFSFFYFWACGP